MANDSQALPSEPGLDSRDPHRLSTAQSLYLWLSGVYVTSLVMANVLGVKLFSIPTGVAAFGSEDFRIEHTVGMIPFPITFLLTDLINEYYGRKATRRVTYVAFAMAFLAFVLISVARRVPILEGIPGTADQAAFENIFGSATLMYMASLVAFLLGSLLDIFVFAVFKHLTGGKLIWLRATGSTVISQVFDSLIVTFLFFWLFPKMLGQPSADLEFVLKTAATGYVLKFFIAVGMTPLIYAGRAIVQRLFGLRPIAAEVS
jgi:uncharacterized integral membrane protein (TIGR00697 family)